MGARAIFDRLRASLDDAVSDFVDAGGPSGVKDAFCKVRLAELPRVATVCRDLPELALGFLESVTAIDYPKSAQIQVVYHLFSHHHRHGFVLKVDLPRAEPKLPSLCGVFAAANWQEREQYDLMGVIFEGHPDLRRLLLPDDWIGHPLRKDYKEAPSYRGMSTSRPSNLDLLGEHDKLAAARAAAVSKAPTGQAGAAGQTDPAGQASAGQASKVSK